MKAIKNSDGELQCLIADAIFYSDNSFSKISGDTKDGFTVEEPENIHNIIDSGWGELYPSFEDENEKFVVIAGETSWGGTGFVALRSKNSTAFDWVMHLSKMNNPTKVMIENDSVRVSTDLNYPNGLDFLIPIKNPNRFKIKKHTANNT